MAKDTQSKKRKASVPEVEAELTKKVKKVVATPLDTPAKKRKATDDASPAQAKKSKTPKPILKKTTEVTVTASSEGTPEEALAQNVSKGSKKVSKKEAGAGKSINGASDSSEKATATSAKKALATKAKKATPPKPEIEVDEELDSGLEDEDKDMEEDSDSEVDDQTLALLKGFESDGDDDDETNAEGFSEGATVPARKELSKKEEKKLKKIAEAGASDKPGVIYIGRIPHGFYENEMKAYFKQFGNILKLRMSRNKKTGASKHYAWIQFESATVADIVARTMDNYLMFGHLLKVKLIPDEQVNPDWFKGANKLFKKVPWNKMQGRKLEQGASEEVWNERKQREEKRRENKAAKLKEIGYEFKAPEVKSATGVAKLKAIEGMTNDESEGNAIEAASVVEKQPSMPKKKGKKTQAAESTGSEPGVAVPSKTKEEHKATIAPPAKEDVEESIDALIAEVVEKPNKKSKKAKAVKETVVEETLAVAEEEPIKPKTKKDKKSKKDQTEEASKAIESKPVTEIPEKAVKAKKSKTSLVETAVVPVEALGEKTKKAKKGKRKSID